MAYSNETTHYGLPQPTSGDKSTFLDTNEAFERVDSALYGAVTNATAAKQQADALTLEVNDLKVSVLDLKSSVLDAKTDINLLMANMGQAMTDINNLQTDTIKLKLDVTDIMVSQLPTKIDTFSGQVEDAEQASYTAVTANGIAYDETNKQLLLKLDGADTVIPFSRGGGGGRNIAFVYLKWAGSQCKGINTDGTAWDITPDPTGHIPAITNESDIVTTTRSGGGEAVTATVLKAGYYFGNRLTGASNEPVFHNVGDTFEVAVGASSGGQGVIIYVGETNPFA